MGNQRSKAARQPNEPGRSGPKNGQAAKNLNRHYKKRQNRQSPAQREQPTTPLRPTPRPLAATDVTAVVDVAAVVAANPSASATTAPALPVMTTPTLPAQPVSGEPLPALATTAPALPAQPTPAPDEAPGRVNITPRVSRPFSRRPMRYPTLARMAAISTSIAHLGHPHDEQPTDRPSPTSPSLTASQDTTSQAATSQGSMPQATSQVAAPGPRAPVTTRRLSEYAPSAASTNTTAHATAHRPSLANPGRADADTDADAPDSAFATQPQPVNRAARFAGNASAIQRRPRHRLQPLPDESLATPIAAGHGALACGSAAIAALLLLQGHMYAFWPLALSVIAGAGAWFAYLFTARMRHERLAGWALTLSQVAALGWGFALLGARPALLMLVPASAALALRLIGRWGAICAAVSAVTLYILAQVGILAFAPSLTSPAYSATTPFALIDGLAICLGLCALLALTFESHDARLRAESRTRAQRYEAQRLRVQIARQRQRAEDDAAAIVDALTLALQGQGLTAFDIPEPEGALRPLANIAADVAERLRTLQRDREDRLRLEGAVRQLTRTLEHAWLGLTWAWPSASGTTLDNLIALLRTPSPRQTTTFWSEVTPPTLARIPSLTAAGTTGARERNAWDTTSNVHTAQIALRKHPLMAHPSLTHAPFQPSQPSQPSSPSLASQPSNPSQPSLPDLSSLWSQPRILTSAPQPALKPIRPTALTTNTLASSASQQSTNANMGVTPRSHTPLPWDEWETIGQWDLDSNE